MFLNRLSEEEKNAFINLSIHAANSNGEFATEEATMIQEYCREMGIFYVNVNNTMAMDEVISVFRNSNNEIKKIVMLETLGLLYADGEYDDSEKGFVKKFSNSVGLTEECVNELTEAVKEYLEILKKVAETIED